MVRSYYSCGLSEFLDACENDIMATMRKNDIFEPSEAQDAAWSEQIAILQDQLRGLDSGHIMFEYTIPRMGKRADTVLIHDDFVFVMEFKVNKDAHRRRDKDQCTDYALDLKNFHEASHCASIVPVLVATKARALDSMPAEPYNDGMYPVACTNAEGITGVIRHMRGKTPGCGVAASDWEISPYRPTPTITEAAKALCRRAKDARYARLDTDAENRSFRNGNVPGPLEDIMRSDASAENLGITTETIDGIIRASRDTGAKSICFVTGVPGSGKTLAALNLVCGRLDDPDGQAVLLSGNETLVDVLQESLKTGVKCTGRYGGVEAAGLIQHIPHFRADIAGGRPPHERIIVFDEAQRAWSAKKLAKSGRDRGQKGAGMSDPDLLIRAMGRHDGWAAIVCLIGEGQEIYDGEVGLSGWLGAIAQRHAEWRVYHSNEMTDPAYLDDETSRMLDRTAHEARPGLHLATSIRSFRGERLADLVRSVLDCDTRGARRAWKALDGNYPIAITRDINRAKEWVREKARGTERYGMVASSGADRLKPHGIYVRSKIKPTKWFLAGKDDMRSSFYLEDAATEFYVQGLELDWVCLAWDANLRYEDDGGWSHHKFHGNGWRPVRREQDRAHLVNAYRVLMTRARQGMVIFVPDGDRGDATRMPEFYDKTYRYLRSIGFEEI